VAAVLDVTEADLGGVLARVKPGVAAGCDLVVESQHHGVAQVRKAGAIDVDPFELVLDTDGVVFPLEIDDAEFLRERRARPRRVDRDIAVDLLVAVVGDADDLAVLHNRRGDASVESILGAAVAAVFHQIAFEIRELEHRAGLVADVMLGRRLGTTLSVYCMTTSSGMPKDAIMEWKVPAVDLLLCRGNSSSASVSRTTTSYPGGEIAGTLCAGGTGTGDDYVVAVVHVMQTVVDLN